MGTIESPALARALIDIYLGKDPASQGAKDAIGAGLAGIVLG